MWPLLFLFATACPSLSNFSDTDSGTFDPSVGVAGLSADLIDFGEVELGEQVTELVVLENRGSLSFEVEALELTDDAFLLEGVTAPLTVDPGQDVVLQITFAPDNEGSHEEELDLQLSNEMGTLSVTLLGVGITDGTPGDSGTGNGGDTGPTLVEGTLEATPSVVDFGIVEVDTTETSTVSLSNTGEQTLVLEDITFSDGHFDWGDELILPYTFSSGASRDITLSFAPDIERSYNETASLTWSGTSTSNTEISLFAEAEESCTFCAPIMEVDTGGSDPHALGTFTSICGWLEDTKTVRISNIGDEDLAISSVSINNDAFYTGGTFSVSFAATTVSPGASKSFDVVYTVTSTGTDVDYWALAGLDYNTIHIRSNDSSEPDYVIGLTGIGVCK